MATIFIVNLNIVFQQELQKILCFQHLKCDCLLVFFTFCDSKVNIKTEFALLIGQNKTI